MTGDELLDAHRTFTNEVVRLETLQHYEVPGDEERQRAFHEGRPLPPRPEKTTSTQIIRDAVVSGRRISRIHVVDLPLSNYVRYEIDAYAENAAAGECVLIADRSADPGLGALREDFVLIDADTDHAAVIWYRYTSEGTLTGWEQGSRTDVAACRAAINLVRRFAVPLSEFLASTHARSC